MTNVKAFGKRRAVALYRVSTDRQGRSGLGLEAQREAVIAFLREDWNLIEEVTEVASGRGQERPGLDRAVAVCRAHNAVLIIARLCRLSRDPHILFGLQRSGVEFIAVDMPGATDFALGVMALVAREEVRWASDRTRQALAARKARGLPLGGNNPNIGEHALAGAVASAEVRTARSRQRAEALKPVVDAIRREGATSLGQIAAGLNDRGLAAPRGGPWGPQGVRNLLLRHAETT